MEIKSIIRHLKNGSIKVEEGDSIKAGDFLGNVGNSGNSTAPHLYINLFDQMDNPLKAKGLPFIFEKYEELATDGQWEKFTSSVLP